VWQVCVECIQVCTGGSVCVASWCGMYPSVDRGFSSCGQLVWNVSKCVKRVQFVWQVGVECIQVCTGGSVRVASWCETYPSVHRRFSSCGKLVWNVSKCVQGVQFLYTLGYIPQLATQDES
jgi:hypothetical protein